jgi:hypothetical protein
MDSLGTSWKLHGAGRVTSFMWVRNALASLVVSGMPCMVLAQDHRVSYLEQEVRNLQRQVMALSRQVDELRRPVQPLERRVLPDSSGAGASPSLDWVDAGKWQKLRVGMGELEVIELLGAPTSMREQDGARVLLYAMELGSSGFLGGSVTFRERAVSEIRKPSLQ